ncbi:neuropeptide F receptor [Eurytemora carolleeae]|uniref:neuropeptide F receptor n=1 Tax=Eurytemora carolleeae TaxID=1294199 RepID=UPI000C7732DE|nr:neuropeptide F receptor [Eurytemora carolleeae]|eukprot:XP_023334629.1 neuropeptide F receptor-like [Eurytemora affinis]
MFEFKKDLETARLDLPTHYVLVTIYSLLIIFGLLGNFAIIAAFLTNKVMLTSRNIFVANLALSDILLCSFTMPLTLIDLVSKHWPMGPGQEVLCKMMGTSQSTCIFFSAFSIVLIAVDRYQFIVNSTEVQISILQAGFLSLFSFLLSVILSLPVFFFTKLEVKLNFVSKEELSYCYEDWSSTTVRLSYTVTCFTCQYLIPSIIVGFAYYRIFKMLQLSGFTQAQQNLEHSVSHTHRRARQQARRKRINILLLLVTLVFFICWTPLNIFNIILNFLPAQKTLTHEYALVIIFSGVHLTAMATVCANPILYGFLNENFKQSLLDIFSKIPFSRQLVIFSQYFQGCRILRRQQETRSNELRLQTLKSRTSTPPEAMSFPPEQGV